MRDLIAAFSSAAKAALVSRGWKKRAGQIFTQDLDGEFFAWLGLNRASKYHPLEVHPVIGVGHEPATVLEARLRGVPPGRTPILSEPLVYLGPSGKRMAELRISGLAEVGPVVARLIELVERSGLPFARPLARRRRPARRWRHRSWSWGSAATRRRRTSVDSRTRCRVTSTGESALHGDVAARKHSMAGQTSGPLDVRVKLARLS